MKRLTLFIFLLTCFLACEKKDISGLQEQGFTETVSTGNITEVLNFGGSRNDVFTSVVATRDNGYIVAGHTQSNDFDITDKQDDSFDFWVVKFDSSHQIQWNRTYGGSDNDRARKIIQTSDGNFVVIGYAGSSDGDVVANNGFRDVWVLKLDPNGDILWQQSFGFAGNDEGFDIKESLDRNLYVAGLIDVTASGGLGETGRFQAKHAGGDYWLLKLDENGQLIWSRYYGGTFTDTAFGVEVSNSNDIYVIGGSDSTDTDISSNKGAYDIWVVKVSETGQFIWEKSYGGSEIDQGKAILKTNQGFLITGDSRSSDQDVTDSKGGADIWIGSINENGEILNSFNLGGSGFDLPRSLISSIDHQIILTGSSRSSDNDVSSNKGQNDLWIVKFDVSGNLIWETSVGGDNIDLGYQAAQLNDGSIIAVGQTSSNNGDLQENKGFADGLLIRIQ